MKSIRAFLILFLCFAVFAGSNQLFADSKGTNQKKKPVVTEKDEFLKYLNDHPGAIPVLNSLVKKEGIEPLLIYLNKNPGLIGKFYDLSSTLDYVRDSYVQKKSSNELMDFAEKGMVGELDRYSHLYLGKDAEEWAKAMKESSYSGVGFAMSKSGGDTIVVKVFDNTPAQKAGIEPGDTILKVDGKDIFGLSVEAVKNMIVGPENSEVTLLILSRKFKKPQLFVINRQKVLIQSVSHKKLDADTGYIDLDVFSDDALPKFKSALEELSGNKNLVIDLRYNPGGLLEVAREMAAYIIGPDKLLITEKGENWPEKGIKTEKPQEKHPKNIAILMNGYSASASEIFSGVLQYYKTATVVGTRSFGKALVQSCKPSGAMVINFVDGKSEIFPEKVLCLTVANYYLPDGTDISKNGVVPDLEVADGEGFSQLDYGTDKDVQLQEAIKYLESQK